MEEIEFRAWDTVGKVMLDWLCIQQTAFNDNRMNGWYGLMYKVFTESQFELMQYTGLKDKTGAKFFEGDIFNDPKLGEDANFLISYDSERAFFRADGIDKKMKLFQHSFRWKDCKIIGNVHENPELLK